MDELEQNPAGVDSADVQRLGPDDLEPTEAAELYIALFPVNRPDVPQPGPPGSTVAPGPPSLRRSGPAVELDVKVPSAQAGRLLRLAERVMLLTVWQTSVVGSLYGAAAAHLPPAGTTAVVVLEIVVPPLLFRRRKRDAAKRHD